MRDVEALLPFIFVLFLTLPAANMEKYALMENMSSETGDPVNSIKECEIVYNNSGGTYRDGIIDNFDHFKNFRNPKESTFSYLLETDVWIGR